MRDKVAVVTGSSKGIGRAVAERLGEGGAHVVINARSAGELLETEQQLRARNCEVTGVALDIAAEDGPDRLVDAATDRYGPVDYVVNLVAVNPYYGPLLAADATRFARTMVVNTWTVVAMVQAAARRGLPRSGAVVNVSTIGARQYQPGLAAYCASKAALEVLTSHLANELGPRGVRVNTVAPGLVQTDMARVLWEGEYGRFEESVLPLRRLGRPEDIAAAVTYLLSDQAAWITGSCLAVDGGRLITSLIHSPGTQS
jgi:NAD(P)-dependent dehydrogenase (short-subunit alcohol dehydrogenase family)